MGKQGEKYHWEIGSTPPDLDEHSQTKHKISAAYLSRYIDTYFQKVMIEKLDLHLVDGFAGGGKYIDPDNGSLVDGSPFLALNTLEEAVVRVNIDRKKPRAIKSNFHFIEKRSKNSAYLLNELHNSQFKSRLGSSIHCHNAAFNDVLPNIVKHIKQQNPRTQRTIFLLDQYAYKDVPMESLAYIFRELSDPEVILTFNFDALQRYLSDRPNNRTAIRNINLEEHISWERLQEWKDAGKWHSMIQEQLAAGIKAATGAHHMTLFFIKGKTKGNKLTSYWLVHLSKRYIARDVMMQIHWDHANDKMEFSHHLNEGFFQLGYQAYRKPKQDCFDIAECKVLSDSTRLKCIEKLSVEIPKLIADELGPITYRSLLDQYGSYTPGSSNEIKAALQTAIDHKEIEVTGAKGERRKSSKSIENEATLDFSRQFGLFK